MDQESLLKGSTSNTGGSWIARCRRNIILLLLAICLAICLTVYLYLNIEVIDASHEQDRFKPLSRRKPILDHESIYEDSGPSMIRLVDLLSHCIVALQVAGRKVVDLSLLHNSKLKQVGSKGKTAEGVDDIVTGVDIKSHRIMLNLIKDSYRRLKVVSEEDTTNTFHEDTPSSANFPLNRVEFATLLHDTHLAIEKDGVNTNTLIAQHDALVWIDPLDATKEYSENLTSYVTLMACIVYQSKPIAGVIHKPFTNETFWSLVDVDSQTTNTTTSHHSSDLKQAFQRYKMMQRNHGDSRLKFIVSRSHAGQVHRFLEEFYGTNVDVVSAGGSGYKTMELVRGQVDAYIHMTHIKKWDICAPHAILHSLHGAALTSLDGSQISFGNPKDKVVTGGLIATLNSTIHQEVVNLSKKQNINVNP